MYKRSLTYIPRFLHYQCSPRRKCIDNTQDPLTTTKQRLRHWWRTRIEAFPLLFSAHSMLCFFLLGLCCWKLVSEERLFSLYFNHDEISNGSKTILNKRVAQKIFSPIKSVVKFKLSSFARKQNLLKWKSSKNQWRIWKIWQFARHFSNQSGENLISKADKRNISSW